MANLKYNVLIRAKRENVEHKIESQDNQMHDVDYCYWTGVRPKKRPLGKVMFCEKGRVYAEGRILGVGDDGLHFEPLRSCDYVELKNAPTRGFTYVESTEIIW